MKNASSAAVSIRNLTAAPGQKVSGKVSVATADGTHTEIPVTLINSFKEGPVLLVLAGVHGSEYTPIVATQSLAHDLEPARLDQGALILVHMSNFPSYIGRSIYTSPVDGKNLNRIFPGSKNGSLTEAIANFLVEEVYPVAAAVMDMHSGDGNEQLSPSYAAYYGKAGSEQVRQASRNLAYAFGVDLIVEFQWFLERTSTSAAIWAGSAAMIRGIPSIDVEMAPGMGLYDPATIAVAYRGILRVMEHLGIVHDDLTGDHAPLVPAKPCLVTQRHFLEAPVEGSWVPMVNAGTFVKEGSLLGYTTDFFGRQRTFECLAPADGLLLMRFEAPPVQAGDTVAVLAILNSSQGACDHFRQASGPQDSTDTSCLAWQLLAAAGWAVALLVFLVGRRRRSADRARLQESDQSSTTEGEWS